MKELPCVVCGIPVVQNAPHEREITITEIDSMSFENGDGASLHVGYGCDLDGDTYFLGICRDCLVSARENNRIIRVGQDWDIETQYK